MPERLQGSMVLSHHIVKRTNFFTCTISAGRDFNDVTDVCLMNLTRAIVSLLETLIFIAVRIMRGFNGNWSNDGSDIDMIIDNINIKDVTLLSLRQQIAVVLQDVFLFADTILSNITLFYKCKLSFFFS